MEPQEVKIHIKLKKSIFEVDGQPQWRMDLKYKPETLPALEVAELLKMCYLEVYSRMNSVNKTRFDYVS